MTLPIYQVDAFTRGPFTGNPAAVCPLDFWLPDQVMQNIALENNLSETAFFVAESDGYRLRWFTPAVEVDLCGHATLATAHVLFNHLGYTNSVLRFNSRSGLLTVSQSDRGLTLDFPADTISRIDMDSRLSEALGESPDEVWQGKTDLLCVFSNASRISQLSPDFRALGQLKGRGILVTAPGKGEFDFVSRGFFPQSGIDEDPATGSAHTTLTPYWSNRLGKTSLNACQLSARKGFFHCVDKGDRTLISGNAHLYMKGEIFI